VNRASGGSQEPPETTLVDLHCTGSGSFAKGNEDNDHDVAVAPHRAETLGKLIPEGNGEIRESLDETGWEERIGRAESIGSRCCIPERCRFGRKIFSVLAQHGPGLR
jgi:hypothetical protein